MQSLPSHSHVLTALVDALSTAPTGNTAANESLPHDRRRMLLTLHVLFPSLLLPALDLLDRRLVTQLVLDSARPTKDGGAQAHGTAAQDDTMTEATQEQNSEPRLHQSRSEVPSIYVVRSVASLPTRRTRDALSASSTSRIYLVRLDAWHCSCAGFALEAFPARPVAQPQDEEEPQLQSAGGSSWLFGGQRHGGLAGNAPCCKHLLACLLARQCGTMMEEQISQRMLSKEELAGMIAEM